MPISHRPYRILADHPAVYQFMLEIYHPNWHNGVPAPFLEYALSSDWMDKRYTHLFHLWFDGDRIVGLVFHENPATDAYFSLRPGYESLTEEMLAYASAHAPGAENGALRLILFEGQTALQEAARRLGFIQEAAWTDLTFDLSAPLDYGLPEGFHFVPVEEVQVGKVSECCWKGFDHEENEGPWDGDATPVYHLLQAPHITPELNVIIANEAGEYVCYSGMWWVPENRLAYMEPLCTVPEYRGRGLAAAALSRHAKRMRALGASVMTGGGNPFYGKIGYQPAVTWTKWRRS